MAGQDDGAIGVGLVGYGVAGSVFHAPLIDAEQRLQLRAGASGIPSGSTSAFRRCRWSFAFDQAPAADQ